MVLVDVNGEEAEKMLATRKIVVADFWAEWCIPCRAVDDALRRLSALIQNHDNISFIRINIDENPDFAAKHGVLNLPTVIVFYKGREYDRISGNISGIEVKIYRLIKQLLNSP